MIKRLAAGLLVTVLMIGGGILMSPREAHALPIPGIGEIVIDPTNLIQNTISATYAGKGLLKPIFYNLAQAAIQSMVRSTVNWINTGFQGSPAYVTDIRATLLDAADQEADRFLGELRNQLAIQSPFSQRLANEVLQTYYMATGRDGFFIRNPYTLNRYSPDDAALARGDLVNGGGLPGFFAQSIDPNNNWIGARFAAQDELANRIAEVRGRLQNEVNQGGGFLSWRRCDRAGGGTEVRLTSSVTCLNERIETPGSVIANQINHSLGLGADSLVQADDFDEIVNALLAQLMQNVLGPSGLGGLSDRSTATGGRDFFNQPVTNQVQAGVSASSSFLQIIDSQSQTYQTYLANWQTINTAAQAAKTAVEQSTCMSQGEKTSVINGEIQPVITEAAEAIGSVPGALNAIDRIRSQVLGSVGQDAAQQTQILQQVSAEYQNLLAGNTLPDATEVLNAAAQAQDTGTDTPPSHLTRMNQIAAQARCGT